MRAIVTLSLRDSCSRLNVCLRLGVRGWTCAGAAGFSCYADASHSMRVLIIEDEPDLLAGLAQALREEGYAVDTAANGPDGLFNAEGTDYDAIVLDVMLPGMDGWEILARLRKQKKTPVLMLTARDQSRDRVRGLDTGADDYVVKPFDLPELLARLRALIRRSANQTTNVIEICAVKSTRLRGTFF
jgi:DNA-binding response OmpR family regulator